MHPLFKKHILCSFLITLIMSPGCENNQTIPEKQDPLPRVTIPVNPQAPLWLGTRALERDESGNILPVLTPLELRNRQFNRPAPLPPPSTPEFLFTQEPVSEEILNRSTYTSNCPVNPEDLSYVTMTYWGFDRQVHTGEMIVNTEIAEDVIQVFSALFSVRFPLEEMRIITHGDMKAEPTGDGNVTTSFVCRPAVGFNQWSEHAYGLAIDINPFQNPYIRGELVLPELARAYTDRKWIRPGMIFPGDTVVQSFSHIGWFWGGDWESPVDYMHFSRNGR